MDAQLRQRLTGALVLIALAVIFLPMLLNGPRQVSNEEVSLAIPPPGTVPADPSERTVTLPADRVTTLPEPDPDAIATVDTATAPPPEDLTQVPVAEVQPAPSTPAPIERPVTPPPAPPKPEPPAPRFEATAAAGGPFFLQLGSYSQSDRAATLIKQLAGLGISASQEPMQVGGKTLYKVRSGGYPNRTAAEAARLKAVGAISGLSASVAEGALPTATASSRQPTAAVSGFAVQVGVFSVQAKATELRDRLKAAGFPAFVEQVQSANGAAHRVRVGPAVKKADAEATMAQIRTRLGLTGLVVAHP